MADNKLKHLEFIQNVITRMNTNSFLIKGWMITLVSAIFALAAKDANIQYVLICYISIPTFCGLDMYYLSMEKQFRDLYKEVALKDDKDIDFSMIISKEIEDDNTWWSAFCSYAIWPLYLTVLAITITVALFFHPIPTPPHP